MIQLGLAVTQRTTSEALELTRQNGGTAATSTSSYHGNDNEDDDDHDDDGDNDGYDDDDDRSVLEAASRISPEQENTSEENKAHTGIIPQLAHQTWIMCQTNCQKFSILLLFSKKILFLFKK